MTESVMVMIPLLLTFLSVLQLSTGVMARAITTNNQQGETARAAISGNIGDSSSSSSRLDRIELPGGGSVIINSRSIHHSAISPLLPGGDNYEAIGLAVSE